MEELEALLQALGVSSFAEAMAAVSRFNSFLSDARASTGRSNTPDTLEALRSQIGLMRSLEATTGAAGSEALARVEAWKLAAERTKQIEAELKAIQKGNDDREAAALMDAATRDGRLPPSSRANAEGFYGEFGLKSLQTFLSTLPTSSTRPSNSDGPRQPRASAEPGSSPSDELTPEERAVAKALKKTTAQMLEGRRLWSETNGEISDAHLFELNEKLVRSRASAGAGR